MQKVFKGRRVPPFGALESDTKTLEEICKDAEDYAEARAGKFGLGGKQQGGTHYGEPSIDPFAFGCAHNLDPVRFSIVKYGMRSGTKGDRDAWILDLRKTIQCAERRALDLGISLEELYADQK